VEFCEGRKQRWLGHNNHNGSTFSLTSIHCIIDWKHEYKIASCGSDITLYTTKFSLTDLLILHKLCTLFVD